MFFYRFYRQILMYYLSYVGCVYLKIDYKEKNKKSQVKVVEIG